MAKFSEYVNNFQSGNSINNSSNVENVDNDNLKKLIDQYSSFSEDQLINEFIKLTLEKKARGEFKEEDIEKIKSTIMPFLDNTQKNKLNELLNMVKNVK